MFPWIRHGKHKKQIQGRRSVAGRKTWSALKLQVPRFLWQAHFANEHGIQAIHKDYHKGHLEPWYPGSKKRGTKLTMKRKVLDDSVNPWGFFYEFW